jgi:hypothetical protein
MGRNSCDHRSTRTHTEKWWNSERDEYFDIDVVTCTDTCEAELSRSGPR